LGFPAKFNSRYYSRFTNPTSPLDIQQQIVDELNAKHEYIKLTEQVIEKQQIEMDKLISYIWR
jgi:restriction endonuclease S subunit